MECGLFEDVLYHLFSSTDIRSGTMKIWKWYKNLTDEQFESSGNLDLEDKYPLYAFTNKKKFAKKFREMRRMKKFIELCTDIEKEDFIELCNKRNRQMLKMYKYSYFPKDKYGKVEDVKILSTGDEKDTTSAALDDVFDADSGQGIMRYNFNPFILKMEYINALNVLELISLWKIYTTTPVDERIANELGFDLDYSYPQLIYDELVGFISIYGDTFKDGQCEIDKL